MGFGWLTRGGNATVGHGQRLKINAPAGAMLQDNSYYLI